MHENQICCFSCCGSESVGQNSEWIFNSICQKYSIASRRQGTWRRENKNLQDQDVSWRGHRAQNAVCRSWASLIDCWRFWFQPVCEVLQQRDYNSVTPRTQTFVSDFKPRNPQTWVSRIPQADFRSAGVHFTEKCKNVKTKVRMSNNIQQVESAEWSLERLKLQVGNLLE